MTSRDEVSSTLPWVILNIILQALQHELVYVHHFHIATAYGSDPAGLGIPTGVGCSAVVTSASGTQISFGVNPYENACPFLNISGS